jgi:hypothetical protein
VRLFGLSNGSPLAKAVLEPHLGCETHRLSDSLHLLETGVLYPALTEVGHVGAGHDSTCGLGELGAGPLVAVRVAVHLQEMRELLGYVHRIYDI